MQAWQQSDNNEQKMNIQIQIISRKEFVKKHEKKERKPNVNLGLGMLLIVWISAAVPSGCCPLSPANYSAGWGHVMGKSWGIFLHEKWPFCWGLMTFLEMTSG